MFSASSLDGMNGGTVSKWVERNTSGKGVAGKVAITLNRPSFTGIRFTFMPRSDSSRCNNSPHVASLPVIDSMSMSCRVSLIGSNAIGDTEYRFVAKNIPSERSDEGALPHLHCLGRGSSLRSGYAL